jgi:hypothetical protein
MSTAKKPKLFDALRTDPKKVSEGVWVTLPDTGDQFLVRRMMCPEYVRAYLAETERLGEDSKGKEGQAKAEAVAMAAGLIIDWKLAGDPKRRYDSAEMAAALEDPELHDLRSFLRAVTADRAHFRPEHAAGN